MLKAAVDDRAQAFRLQDEIAETRGVNADIVPPVEWMMARGVPT